MNGIYIRGLEKPRNCAMCRLRRGPREDMTCFDYAELGKENLKTCPEWCRLTPIEENCMVIFRDGIPYKINEPVPFPNAPTVNLITGETYYPTNLARVRSMRAKALAKLLTEPCPPGREQTYLCENGALNGNCTLCWTTWLEEADT
jgi:hypothetical protein